MHRKFYEASLKPLHEQSFAWALRCSQYNHDQAREALQNAYVKVFSGKARFKKRSSFKTWWFSVIRHTVIDLQRKVVSQQKRMKPLTTITEEPSEFPLFDEKWDSERTRIFQIALRKLSVRQQEVLQLVFYHDMTIAEAADIMGITVGSARTHYKRGKEQLKKWLLKAGIPG